MSSTDPLPVETVMLQPSTNNINVTFKQADGVSQSYRVYLVDVRSNMSVVRLVSHVGCSFA